MWKVNVLESRTLGRAIDCFVRDFLYWAKSQDPNSPLDYLAAAATSQENKLGKVAQKTMLKHYLAQFSKCPDLIEIIETYNNEISGYRLMLDGVIPHSKISQSSQDLIVCVFNYFYDSLLDSETFRKVYLPFYQRKLPYKNGMRQIFNEKRKVCPYCDAQTIISSTSSIDHFFPRQRFPLLSVYSRNLVVSCSGCNERLKTTRIPLPIFHPLFHQPASYFVFEFNEDFSEITILNKATTKIDSDRVENYLSLFGIHETYNSLMHKIHDARITIRRSVKRRYKDQRPTGKDEILLRKLYKQELLSAIRRNCKKIGEFELTKVQGDLFITMINNLQNEMDYLCQHMRIG